MLTPLIGVIVLAGSMVVAFMERAEGELSFFDWHAAVVVFGGVVGSLMIAVDRAALFRMLMSVKEILPLQTGFKTEMKRTLASLEDMKTAWGEGRRRQILEIAEKGRNLETQMTADALLRRLDGHALQSHFTELRTVYAMRFLSAIEGWEMVGRLAPSFGMVGTVTGMVQLFRNMAENSSNIGGAMAMALLATLYGIAVGAAVGGPMASRLNNQLNERLNVIDLLEHAVAALVSGDRSAAKQG